MNKINDEKHQLLFESCFFFKIKDYTIVQDASDLTEKGHILKRLIGEAEK